MNDFSSLLMESVGLILLGDSDLVAIIALSLQITFSALFLACLVGFPLGAFVGIFSFPGRNFLAVLLNTLMGLPPVVVGLGVYLLISASGPLGPLGLLYTPSAMIIAQFFLITPIIAALTKQQIEDCHRDYAELFDSLGVGPEQRMIALLWDARYGLLTVALAGFGRAVAEVGAVLMVGGNINHVTRVMTTTIALETAKGNLELAFALGLVLLLVALIINAAVMILQTIVTRRNYG